MKNILIMAVLFIAAYTLEAADVYIGPRVGINFSTLKIMHATTAERNFFNNDRRMYTGYNAGADFFIRFNNFIGLEPEFNMTMKGLKYVNGSNVHVTKIMQLEWPIMLKAGYGTPDYFVYGAFGPYFSVNTMGKEIARTPDATVKTNVNFNNFRRGDVGLGIGVGGMWFMKNKNALDVEFRYNMGMVRQDIPLQDPNVMWSAYGLSMAYTFGIKHTAKVKE